jgi:hypothetical protein
MLLSTILIATLVAASPSSPLIQTGQAATDEALAPWDGYCISEKPVSTWGREDAANECVKYLKNKYDAENKRPQKCAMERNLWTEFCHAGPTRIRARWETTMLNWGDKDERDCTEIAAAISQITARCTRDSGEEEHDPNFPEDKTRTRKVLITAGEQSMPTPLARVSSTSGNRCGIHSFECQ